MNPLIALLLFPFQPRRVALAFKDASMGRVYLIHWMGMLAVGLVLVWLDYACSNEWRSVSRSVVLAIVNDPRVFFGTVLTILACEGCFMATAMLTICWAGRDEPLMETWRYTLRVSWLYTAHLVWVVAVWSAWFAHFTRVGGPSDRLLAIMICVCAAVIIWSIITYLRALTAHRDPLHSGGASHCVRCGYDLQGLPPNGLCPECATPTTEPPEDPDDPAAQPLCEWCGYLLMRIDPHGACPECGRPVAESVADNPRRPFSARSLRRELRVWWDSERFFRELAAARRSPIAARIVASSLAASSMAGAISFILSIALFLAEEMPPAHIFVAVLAALGGLIGWTQLMVLSAIASLLGVIATRRAGRNRLTHAWNVVAFFSLVLPVWSLFSMGLLPLLMQRRVTTYTLLGWLIGNVAVAVLFGIVCARRLPYVQYANR